jgi:hopanoid biosynthesis associated RND transporter like protein HpnN
MTELTFGNSAMPARLERVVAFSVGRAGLVITLALVLAVAGGVYTARNIGISTDTAEMLSPTLDWRIAYDEFKREFPYFSDTIVVVVDAATPELARETASAIAAKAQTSPHFEAVFNPLDSPFLKRNQLLYLAIDDLESLTNDIAGSQAILGSLAAEPSLVKLLDLLNQIMTRDDTTPDSGRFVDTIAQAIGEVLNGDDVPMSWQNLTRSEAVDGAERLMFTVTPKLDYAEILPAKPAMDALHSYIAELDRNSSVTVRLTGAAALAHDELSAVIRGAEQAAILALTMVAACLIVGLRSGSLVVATLLTLCTGLVLTASAACLLVGKLNMISVAFAVLYVGLGVDFAIHVGLRYRELCGELSKTRAVIYATSHIGESILLCAITTAIAFFAFIPTEYRGVAELGLISGVGMLIALATTFTLLPALLSRLPPPRAARPASAYEPGAGKRIPAGKILTATTLLTAAAALT